MDISVRRLNGRLATKLPPELPLGLVFVVGKVAQIEKRRFLLREEQHVLSCRTNEEVALKVGDEVRASGHLMFDTELLQYYLLARDVEIVSSEPLAALAGNSRELLAENDELLAALAMVKARAAAAPTGKSEGLPVWVKKLAPSELPPEEMAKTAVVDEPTVATATEVSLDERLVSMLSAAMDSDDDLELTPELLAPYQVSLSEPVAEVMQESGGDRLMDTAVPTAPTSYQPANREDTDWLVILLIISFFVLTIAAFVTIVLLILQ